MEQMLYSQVFISLRRESDDKKEKEKQRNITSKGNQKDQDVGLILIMSGQKKIPGYVNYSSILKNYQNEFWGDDKKTYQIFGVTVGNTKTTRE